MLSNEGHAPYIPTPRESVALRKRCTQTCRIPLVPWQIANDVHPNDSSHLGGPEAETVLTPIKVWSSSQVGRHSRSGVAYPERSN